MNTPINFTIGDLLISLFWIALIVMIVFLIGILRKAYMIVKKVDKIVETNKENINLILNEAPGITKNVEAISSEIAHASQQFRGTVDNVAETTETITGTIKSNNSINEIIKSIYLAVTNVKNLIDKIGNKTEEL